MVRCLEWWKFCFSTSICELFRYYRGMSVSKLIYLLVTKFSISQLTLLQRMSCFFSVIFSQIRCPSSELAAASSPPWALVPLSELRNPAERPLFKTLVEELRDLYLAPPPWVFFSWTSGEWGPSQGHFP